MHAVFFYKKIGTSACRCSHEYGKDRIHFGNQFFNGWYCVCLLYTSTKARGIAGEEVRPFEAKLLQTDQDKLNWTVQELEDAESEQIQKLLGEGLSIRDCAEELGISKSKAHRLKQRLEHL